MEFDVLKEKVIHYSDLDDYDSVLEICQQIIQLFPESFFGYNGRGNCKLKEGDYDSAYEDFQIALEKSPDDYWVLCKLGNVHYHRKEYPEAIRNYTLSLRDHPCHCTVRNRGNTYLDLNQFRKGNN